MKTATKKKPVKNKPVINDKIYNLHHPDFHGKTEFAFKSQGVKYYNFGKDTDVRYMRYVFMQNFLQEVNLRASLETLQEENKIMTAWLDGSKGSINIGKVLEMLSIQRQRCNLSFEPETVFRLASCLYFDETEDLRDWNKDHNEKKIKQWKESHTIDFFFHKLFQELTGLKDISRTALQNYLAQVPETLKGWRLMVDILSR